MIKIEGFWEKEGQAPIVNLENKFVQNNTEAVLSRAQKWASLFPKKQEGKQEEKVKEKVKEEEEEIDENYRRIFVADAERTFRTKENREKMVKLLNHQFSKFKDYSQSMGYVTAFLSLFLEQDDAETVLTHLAHDAKYIPEYWRAQAVAFSRDAFVFQSMLEKFNPEVSQHLAKNSLFPDTYCQKWFSGLCIHVLDYNQLFDFFDHFMEKGHVYLFKFGLSVAEVLKESILKTNNVVHLFEILRLEKKWVTQGDLVQKILDLSYTDKFDQLGDIEELRKVAYETKVKPRLEASNKKHEEKDSDDEIVFSDEEEEEEEELAEKLQKMSVKDK